MMSDPRRMISRSICTAALLSAVCSPALGAERASDQQLQGLMDRAAQAPDSPDHDYVPNSLQSLMRQAKDLNLTQEQQDKIKTIGEQYERTRHDRETAYKQSEMDALKLIHDQRSSLTAVEAAVQKADQEHSKLRMAGIRALREAADVLRPEQYSQWRQDHAARQLAQSNRHQSGQKQGDTEFGVDERIAPH